MEDRIILVDVHGDAVAWAGATMPIFDFNYDDIAKFATTEEADSFAAKLGFQTYVDELREEFIQGLFPSYPPDPNHGEPTMTANNPTDRPEPTDEPFGLDEFMDGYVEAALWSSMDQSDENTGGEPLDANYSADDIAPETLAQMRADCAAFLTANGDDIETAEPGRDHSGTERAGHDFWLTRNGHGAGFWDGDYEDDIGTRLTDASNAFGEYDLYLGDDGKIHGM